MLQDFLLTFNTHCQRMVINLPRKIRSSHVVAETIAPITSPFFQNDCGHPLSNGVKLLIGSLLRVNILHFIC